MPNNKVLFPILELRGGALLLNVEVTSDALRDTRPNRYDTDMAADCIDHLTKMVNRLHQGLAKARHDLQRCTADDKVWEDIDKLLAELNLE